MVLTVNADELKCTCEYNAAAQSRCWNFTFTNWISTCRRCIISWPSFKSGRRIMLLLLIYEAAYRNQDCPGFVLMHCLLTILWSLKIKCWRCLGCSFNQLRCTYALHRQTLGCLIENHTCASSNHNITCSFCCTWTYVFLCLCEGTQYLCCH